MAKWENNKSWLWSEAVEWRTTWELVVWFGWEDGQRSSGHSQLAFSLSPSSLSLSSPSLTLSLINSTTTPLALRPMISLTWPCCTTPSLEAPVRDSLLLLLLILLETQIPAFLYIMYAVCLDGSVPAYHFQKGFGSGSHNWLLHIEVSLFPI